MVGAQAGCARRDRERGAATGSCACLPWPTLRNQEQENTISVQFVPGTRFLVFDFGVYMQPTGRRQTVDIAVYSFTRVKVETTTA
eukprot:2416513-Rhodomonas_salina.1